MGKGLWGRVKGQDGKDQGLQTTDPPGFTKLAQKSNEASISTTTDPPTEPGDRLGGSARAGGQRASRSPGEEHMGPTRGQTCLSL